MATETKSGTFDILHEELDQETWAARQVSPGGSASFAITEEDRSIHQEAFGVTHLEIVRVIERLHRRSLDLMRADLVKAGVDDLSPSQVMMLFTIGTGDLSVRELIERGYYLGSNASYSLKQLVQAGYVIRTASERDRRSARIRLSEKGHDLCEMIKRIDRSYHQLVTRSEDETQQLETTFRTLNRLEQAWTNAVRYGRRHD